MYNFGFCVSCDKSELNWIKFCSGRQTTWKRKRKAYDVITLSGFAHVNSEVSFMRRKGNALHRRMRGVCFKDTLRPSFVSGCEPMSCSAHALLAEAPREFAGKFFFKLARRIERLEGCASRVRIGFVEGLSYRYVDRSWCTHAACKRQVNEKRSRPRYLFVFLLHFFRPRFKDCGRVPFVRHLVIRISGFPNKIVAVKFPP